MDYRTIAPPGAPPDSEQHSITQVLTARQGVETSLARYNGVRAVPLTITCFRTYHNAQDRTLPNDLQVAIFQRHLNVSWEETYPWPASGLIRRIVAHEAKVTVKPPQGTAVFTPGYEVGAAIVVGINPVPDGFTTQLALPGQDTLIPTSCWIPQGARAFRAWSQAGLGALQFGSMVNSARAVDSDFEPLPLPSCTSWVPIPNAVSALFYVSPVGQAEFGFVPNPQAAAFVEFLL
jgi:hypothetical protein